MTQVEISWELCSIESTVSRIKEITNAERDLLLGLVRIYYRARQLGNGYHDSGDGRIKLEPSKGDLAKAIGVGLATVKRRLRDLRDLPNGSRYISIDESSWRTHCYEIYFSAIYSADLIEIDPGSGGSIRGITRGITQGGQGAQGDHDSKSSQRLRFQGSDDVSRGITEGDQGDQILHHTIEPYHKDHSGKPEIQNTINHGANGSDGSLKRFSFIDLRKAEFRDPESIEKRFREVVAAKIAKDCEADRVAFFALMVHLRRSTSIKNPAGLLTKLIRGEKDPFGKTWRTRPTNRDDERARQLIRKLDQDETLARDPRADAYSFDDHDDQAAELVPLPDQPANALPAEVVRELPAEIADQIREFQERKRKELAKR